MSAPAHAGASLRDAAKITALALAARLAVVAWAAGRFPPTADGTYYHRIAERIAAGLGYTWLWPDGAVTFAAHYPVGYPGAVGALYALAGPRPGVAMVLNAVIGALAAFAVHRLAARALEGQVRARRGAALAGLLVALHPGLVAYTPALMTEGITAALVTCAAWLAAEARGARSRGSRRSLGWLLASGLCIGAATLVRPQSLVLAPLFGALAWTGADPDAPPGSGPVARSLGAAAMMTLVALLVCAPWTARNCSRMGRCALVSVNGGWNLLIGADPASTGAWAPVEVPERCREVWDEAAKDECFGLEARRYITDHPGAWLRLVPRKLGATFDYCGAAPWYLHEANPAAFGDRAKLVLGGVETLYERAVLLLALLWALRAGPVPGRASRAALLGVLVVSAVCLLTTHAWVSYLGLLVVGLTRWRLLARGPLLPAAALGVLLSLALTHAVFFGAGRYGLVAFPLLCGLAALGWAGQPPSPSTFDRGQR